MQRPRRTSRGGIGWVLLLVAVLSFAATAPAAGSAEGSFFGRINTERSASGAARVQWAGDLAAVAERHSAEMARSGRIWHSSGLGSKLRNWRAIGENVGMGPSVSAVHERFMSSSAHSANILGRRFTVAAVGVAVRGDDLYVTELFVDRASVAAAAPKSRAVRPPPRLKQQRVSRSRGVPRVVNYLEHLGARTDEGGLGRRPQPKPSPSVPAEVLLAAAIAMVVGAAALGTRATRRTRADRRAAG